MNDARFAAWTRRRIALATSGAVAAALGLAAGDAGQAKRKKRKKRCRRINTACQLDSKKKRCCRGLQCDEGKVVLTSLSCCRHFQAHCESELECCTSFKCQPAVGLAGDRCCAPTGTFCGQTSDCCASLVGTVACGNHTCTLSL